MRTQFSYHGHGEQLSPFVMNSEAEIRQAIDDVNSGRFTAMR